jgi:hypothetical protein
MTALTLAVNAPAIGDLANLAISEEQEPALLASLIPVLVLSPALTLTLMRAPLDYLKLVAMYGILGRTVGELHMRKMRLRNLLGEEPHFISEARLQRMESFAFPEG